MNKKSRDELIMSYAPLVKNIVLRMAAKLPICSADKEDLINVGIIGLMTAVEKFDKSRNVQFETYARFRIRGAVLDELRARDWVPRSTRNKDNKLEEAFAVLQHKLGRAPDECEISQHLGITLDEYFELIDEVRNASIISRDDIPPNYLEKYGCDEVVGYVDNGTPLNHLVGQELIEGLRNAINNLPPKERMVLSLYYYDELTMKEIGRVLELTESRVCQIHAQATVRLRSAVKDLR